MRLLVGLGNPGERYAKSRHNLGFDCVEAVRAALGGGEWRSFKDGLLCELVRGRNKLLLFKPQTFMNCSGLPVAQVASYYRIQPEDVAICLDDVYVAPGTIRIRRSGGDGGHNGLRSVIEQLHPDSFWRVRIGAGLYKQRLDERQHLPDLDEYVLQPLPAHEAKNVRHTIDNAVPLLVGWLERGELQEQTVHFQTPAPQL